MTIVPSPCPTRPMTNGYSSRTESPPLPLEPNVKEVVLGDLWIKPWFPSFYPEELVGPSSDRLYVCKWCFKYTKDLVAYLGHTVGDKLESDLEQGWLTVRKMMCSYQNPTEVLG